MEPARVLSGLLSALILGGVVGLIFYFFLKALRLLPGGSLQFGITEAIVIGALGGVLLRLVGNLSG